MAHQVISGHSARSLVWSGDALVDWAGGGVRLPLAGEVSRPAVFYAYRFDAAAATPDGQWAVLYERLGTKGIIHHLDPLPPLALDPGKRRFALAQGDEVHVITLDELE